MPKRDCPSSSSSYRSDVPRRGTSSSSSSSTGHRSGGRRGGEVDDDAMGVDRQRRREQRVDVEVVDVDDKDDDVDDDNARPPDFDSSDPYEILGVPNDASTRQIKLSYRKLALRHHPDRQSSREDKDDAHRIFSAIGNAYEILGDEARRREHDREVLLLSRQRQQQQQQQRHHGGGRRGGGADAGRDPFASAFEHPFFSRSRANFHFTDPFRLFEEFFADERMGDGDNNNIRRDRQYSGGNYAQSSSSRNASSSASSSFGGGHPFFSDPFFSDPFFSSTGGDMMGGGTMSPFGGMMAGHFDRMNAMMSQMSQMHHRGMSQMQRGMSSTTGGGGNGGLITSSFGSSSSSFHGGGGGGRSVSTSTRTTVINGVRKTVTERTVVHPDGRVERHVETTGDDGHDRDYNVGRSLPPSSSYGDRHLPLDYNGGGGGSSRRRHK